MSRRATSTILLVLLIACLAPGPGEIIFAQPSDEATRQLCESEEGRQQIIASRDPREIQDIEFQEMGLALSEGREPDLDRKKREWVAEYCGITPSKDVYTFNIDYSGFPVEDPARPGMFVSHLSQAWMECNVDYDEDCDMPDQPIALPEFWTLQACRLEFDVAKRGKDAGYAVTKIAPIPDEPGLTRRFRGFAIRLWAHGRHTILDRVGAKMRVGNLRFYMVPKSATEDERRRYGCEFYPVPVAPPRPQPDLPTTPRPKPTLPEFQDGTADEGRSYRFALTNRGKVASTVDYVVYITDSRGRREHAWGRQTVEPGTMWSSQGFHSWENGVRWQTRIALVQ